MRALVTGSSGFLGRYLCEELDRTEWEWRSFDTHTGMDVMNRVALARRVKDCDAVIHLAGVLGTSELFEDPHQAVDVNVHGALNVLQACQEAGAAYVGITMPSSGWANVYQATKHCAQELAEAWRRYQGLHVSHVRAFNVFGAGQKHGPGHPRKIIPDFATRAWAGEPLIVWGDGEQTVDLVHVRDVAKVFVAVLRADRDGLIVDAGTGTSFSVNEVAKMVLDVTGSSSEIQHLPMRDGEVPGTTLRSEGCGWDAISGHPAFRLADLEQAVLSYRPDA